VGIEIRRRIVSSEVRPAVGTHAEPRGAQDRLESLPCAPVAPHSVHEDDRSGSRRIVVFTFSSGFAALVASTVMDVLLSAPVAG